MSTILIVNAYRALTKIGQMKSLEDVRVADIHKHCVQRDYWLADTFGVHVRGKVKILKSSTSKLLVDQVYDLDQINSYVESRMESRETQRIVMDC